ncbi:MAG TPA: RebB family R body protein [Allosphingosinicella sp.]|jgi:hypothetical protein|nr:RebB family R body protein [Allosphingosinicella sp.]
MADPADFVDPQITDAVTQVNVKVVAEAPAIAMGTLYQTLAHSTGLMFTNAVNAQNSQNVLQQAATTQGVIQIYSVDTMADAAASTGLAESLIQILQTNRPVAGR